MPHRAPALWAMVLLSPFVSSDEASAYVLARDGGGRALAWRAQTLELVLVPTSGPLGAELLSATERAAQRWAEASGLEIAVRAEFQASPGVSEDGRSSVVLRTRRWCPDDPMLPCHDPSRHALTQLYTRPVAGHPGAAEILEADIEVNAVHFDWRALPPRSLDAVMLHELGHVLGLEHTCNASSLLERVDHRGAPVPKCRAAPPAVLATIMYPDPLDPVAGSRLELSEDERRAAAELYAAASGATSQAALPRWAGVSALMGLLGLATMSALRLTRNRRRARSSHGA